MPNFVLKKHQPIVAGRANEAYSWIVLNNEVWISTDSQILYSSNFGSSFAVVYDEYATKSTSSILLYRYNNITYAVAIELGVAEFFKWNGTGFTNIFSYAGINSLVENITVNATNAYFVGKVSNNVLKQTGDSFAFLFNTGAGDSGDSIAIGTDVFFAQNNFPTSPMYKYDGVSVTTAFTGGDFWYGALYEFSALVFYYERINKTVGTINMTTGATSPILILPEAANIPITSVCWFVEIVGKLYLVVGRDTIGPTAFDGVRIYEYTGATFIKVYEDTARSVHYTMPVGLNAVIGLDNNDYFENECLIFYNGATKTDETNVSANDGTITHDVDITAAVGIVNYRLLDASEVEVATWQASNVFTGLAPGSYLLEARDDTCTVRYINTVGILAFDSAVEEQTPSRSRNYLNSPNFTRFYQIYGMTVQDFQALEGELPPPTDEAIGAVPDTANVRVDSNGNTRVTSTGDRRVTS